MYQGLGIISTREARRRNDRQTNNKTTTATGRPEDHTNLFEFVFNKLFGL